MLSSSGRNNKKRHLYLMKKKSTNASLLALLDFDKTFEIECDTFGIGNSVILMHRQNTNAILQQKIEQGGPKLGYVGQGVAYIGLRITDIETMIP